MDMFWNNKRTFTVVLFLSGWEKNNVVKGNTFFVVFMRFGSSVDAS